MSFSAEFELGCKVYAYCLMTNRVHLIVDPGEDGAKKLKAGGVQMAGKVRKIEQIYPSPLGQLMIIDMPGSYTYSIRIGGVVCRRN